MTSKNGTQKNEPKTTKALKTETPQQRAKRLQRENTREAGSLKLIEKTNRGLNNLTFLLNQAPRDTAVLIARIVLEASEEKDREIIRLRRALIRTQVRLERTTGSLLPKLRSKANEVRNLRKKLGIGGPTGARMPKRYVEELKKLKDTARAEFDASVHGPASDF